MDDYDEVITDNPFYKAFQNKAKSLYNLAAEKRWLVSNLFFLQPHYLVFGVSFS